MHYGYMIIGFLNYGEPDMMSKKSVEKTTVLSMNSAADLRTARKLAKVKESIKVPLCGAGLAGQTATPDLSRRFSKPAPHKGIFVFPGRGLSIK